MTLYGGISSPFGYILASNIKGCFMEVTRVSLVEAISDCKTNRGGKCFCVGREGCFFGKSILIFSMDKDGNIDWGPDAAAHISWDVKKYVVKKLPQCVDWEEAVCHLKDGRTIVEKSLGLVLQGDVTVRGVQNAQRFGSGFVGSECSLLWLMDQKFEIL